MRVDPMLHRLKRTSKAEKLLYYKEKAILGDHGPPTTGQLKELLTVVWFAINKNQTELTIEQRLRVQAMRATRQPKEAKK